MLCARSQASLCLSRTQPAPLRTQSFPVKHSVWYIASLQGAQAQAPEVSTPRVRGNEVRPPSTTSLVHASGVRRAGCCPSVDYPSQFPWSVAF